ncbi:MFS transporter [Streptomyces venezuelae]|uniref:MFS transporter n=1 Tax=Streptomyces venezuelae TaxID=54571 RepID=UPI001681EC8E|nr:MFS transporter [Streptomyces venezuelae]
MSATDTTTSSQARIVLIITVVASALLVIDITIVSVALPEIQSDLGGSLAALQWIIIGYTVTFGAFQQAAGSLSDRLGRRAMFMGGIALFTLSSLACGIAPNAIALDIARCVQGMGAAFVLANAMPLIAQVYEGQARNMAIAVWGTTLGACGAVAPVVGGLLVDLTEWRYLFLINVPVGVVALFLCRTRLPLDPPRSSLAGIDWTGAGLLVLTLGLVNFALTRGEDQGWGSAATLVQLGVSAVLLAGFLFLERRVAAPTLDLSLFKVPTFVAATLIAFFSRFATIGGSVYYILYFQSARGLSPLQTGLMMMAIFAPQLGMGLVAGKLQAKYSPSHIIGAGFGILALGGLAMSWSFDLDQAIWVALPGLLLWGVGGGLAGSPSMSLAVNVVPKQRAGMASGAINSLFMFGAGIGAAIFGVLFRSRIEDQAGGGLRTGSADRDDVISAAAQGDISRAVKHVPDDLAGQARSTLESAIADGASFVMLWAAVVCVGTAAVALTLVRKKDLLTGAPEPAKEDDKAAPEPA